ncbi:4-alpha-glucanotransferase, putative [Eimeria necatrix]|uniref:4-alpha-glucanotransferase n=1 Tax=Eimeria necatrix TaxID=51315 RepID=U6MR20_9EIME|nr:4-alpha-glucanotransferase, putative [Eimeria necatrix]CDJ64934.1 4-alpha-glucanotransferase, putative [Eimeria necatrix]
MDFMYEGREAGVLLHPTSLPSKCGIVGDFGESAEPFLDYLRAAGFSYWQVLPVGPCTYSQSQPGCPYLSTSSFALNPLLVCPAGLVSSKLVTQEDVAKLVAKWQAKQQERRTLNTVSHLQEDVDCEAFVDYHVAKGYKDELLALAYKTFTEAVPTEEYEDFCKSNKFWLDGYVLFEAIQARHPDASSWLDWPEEYRSFKSLVKNESLMQGLESPTEDQSLSNRSGGGPPELLLPQFHRFVQFILSKQWSQLRRRANSKGIKILGDIAFYVNMHSSDAWSNSEMFQMDSSTNKPLYVSGKEIKTLQADGAAFSSRLNFADARPQQFLLAFAACKVMGMQAFHPIILAPKGNFGGILFTHGMLTLAQISAGGRVVWLEALKNLMLVALITFVDSSLTGEYRTTLQWSTKAQEMESG